MQDNGKRRGVSNVVVGIITIIIAGVIFFIIAYWSGLFQPRVVSTVDATLDWQSSGIAVQKDSSYTIRVVGGAWTHSRVPLKDVSPAAIAILSNDLQDKPIYIYYAPENPGQGEIVGCDKHKISDCPMPKENIGALVARIVGSDNSLSEVLFIGSSNTIVAPMDGVLQFRINDGLSDTSNNSGIIAVEVR